MNKNFLTILLPLFLGIQILYSQSSSAALRTAALMEKQGNLENAVAIYEGLLKNEPKNLQAYQKLKKVYKKLGNYPKTVLLIKEHIKLFPNDLQSHLELGEAKYLNKNIKGAEKIWNDLESKFGNTPNPYRILTSPVHHSLHFFLE
jgi:tetratricopeptide (TPR) repeat protein